MEFVLQETKPVFKEHSYSPPQVILAQVRVLPHKDRLQISSNAVKLTIACQLRHSPAPLMNLTGGMDSRAIIATAVGLGYHPECNVLGKSHFKEVKLATEVSEALDVPLHCLPPGKHYAENLDTTAYFYFNYNLSVKHANTNKRIRKEVIRFVIKTTRNISHDIRYSDVSCYCNFYRGYTTHFSCW
jgi:hypothetical protein